jgi:hypothetical protein
MIVAEIPLQGRPQRFTIALGEPTWLLRFQFRVNAGSPFGNADGTWILDIAEVDGAMVAAGIPLITGANLLEQYDYLGFEGELWAAREGSDEPPTYFGLGITSHLYWVVLDESDKTSRAAGLAAAEDRRRRGG